MKATAPLEADAHASTFNSPLRVSAKTPLLSETRSQMTTASAPFAKEDHRGRRLPQNVAHRGYKAKFPENTITAFQAAVEVGVDGIETDVHVSRDGVVVISHDNSLKRCFGVDKDISDCDWSYLKTLRTLQAPHEKMPSLQDLLEFLAMPANEHIWLLFDIKMDNDMEEVFRLMAKTVQSVRPAPGKPWRERLVLGCWALDYLEYCETYFPGFPITHIGYSISYARKFLPYPNVSFNMLQPALFSPSGRLFLRKCRELGRSIFCWTVNDETMMRWCIRKQIDAVLTDNPQKFRDICENWDEEDHTGEKFTMRQWVMILLFNLFAFLASIALFFVHPGEIFKFMRRLNGNTVK